MIRQQREQLTQIYIGVRDGQLAAHFGADKAFAGGRPSYATEAAPAKTGEDLFRDFAHLVERRDH